jgi:hypothetical protein
MFLVGGVYVVIHVKPQTRFSPFSHIQHKRRNGFPDPQLTGTVMVKTAQ